MPTVGVGAHRHPGRRQADDVVAATDGGRLDVSQGAQRIDTREEAVELVGSRRRPSARPEISDATACHAAAVSKVYGRRDTAVHALRDVTLSIERGAFTAIMGPSGSGKSTLLHCLAALDTPTSGRVYLGRTELTALNRRQQAQVRRDRIGFVFQAFNLVPTLDAIENITLPQLLAGRRPDRQWLDHVITAIGLGDRLRHRPSELSGGQQQRVALARALAGRPEVIFADEPTGNLDTRASGEMLTLLRDAVDRFDQTVITVTHDPAIAQYADRVLFFTDGRVVDQADRPDVDQVLQRVQATDAVGDPHARPRRDWHDTMRSRRRRQSDENAPGRPMVGSDDEVEVARQERWLQRIREQFEAEQGIASDMHGADGRDPWSTEPTLHDNGDPGARPLTPPLDADVRQPHDGVGPDQPPAIERGAAWAAPGTEHDGGWLPPQRSWADEDVAGADEAGQRLDGQSTPPGSTPWSQPTDEPTPYEDATGPHPPQPTPWSRPADEAPARPWTNGRPTADWRSLVDPWAPPDRDRADEYRNGAGTTNPSRGRQSDGRDDDTWSTPGSRERDEDRYESGRPAGPPTDPEPSAPAGPTPETARTPRFERWRPPTDDVARNGRAHDDVWRSDDRHTPERDPWTDVWDTTPGSDAAETWAPPSTNGRDAYDTGEVDTSAWTPPTNDTAPHSDTDDPPAWTPPTNGTAPHSDTDDPPAWTPPTNGTAPHSDAAAREAPRGETPDTDPPAPDEAPAAPIEPHTPDETSVADPAAASDTPPADDTTHNPEPLDETSVVDPDTPPADDTIHDPEPQHDTATRPPVPTSDTPAAIDDTDRGWQPRRPAPDRGAPRATTPAVAPVPRPIEPEPLGTPRQHTTGQTPDARRNERRPPRDEPMIPPQLASLRNPRRPDRTEDASDALQSLQAQLARLGGGWSARTTARRPHGTGTGDDTNRRERR